MGAPSTAIFFAKFEFEASITASPLTRSYYAGDSLAKDRKEAFRLAANNIPGFPRDFERPCTTRGNKILMPAFWYEAATRRSSRRLSRIAKGPLTRCSERALARIAKGVGLIDGQ